MCDFCTFTEVEADPRRIVEKYRIIWNNVTKNDATVIQCNATNDHGYIFKNAYLNVLSELTLLPELRFKLKPVSVWRTSASLRKHVWALFFTIFSPEWVIGLSS